MRKIIGPIIVVIVVLAIIFGGALVGLYTDWLWFKDLGYSQIFTTLLLTKIELGLLFGFLFFAIIYSNLWYARKIAPPPSPMGLEQQLLDRLGRFARRLIGIALFVGSIVVSAMVGLEAATHWEEWLKFLHPTPFGVTDPVFHHDVGFYVFRLPFLSYFYHWLFFALAASTIAAAALHYADEALDVFGNRLQFAPKVKAHLGVLVAAMFFLKAWGYKLSMYDLLFQPGKLFDGAGYTSIHANLPAFWILLVAALVGGVLVLVNVFRRGVTLAVAGLAGVVGLSIVVGAAYPALLQALSVSPNELEKESPYISTAIAATRAAYGLTEVVARPYAADPSLTAAQVNENIPTIENIRLWDSGHLLDAYSQVQTIQQYYHFPGVDVDRYWLADKPGDEKRYRQVWLGPRELAQSSLPANSQTWVNQHLQYTHGYGFCMSPVNEVSVDGMPVFFAKDIPTKTTVDLPVDRSGIYFGEMTDSYALVKTSAQEFDYPSGAVTKATVYQGSGGVRVGGFWRRLLFALRFSDVNILLNQNIKPESRVLFTRNIRERIETLLPFLTFDQDPYLVTVYGRLYWMRDGYTTSDAYPYAQHIGDDGFNYIRNSVKVVVDAYTGQVSVYTVERPLRDPMIETYAKIFPGVFKPLSQMPSELRAHLRYPEDLFRVQTNIYKRYHMIDPVVYYNDSDRWDIPAKADLLKTGGGDEQMEPYYIIMKLPNGEREEFILMTPYIRAGKQNMVAWICAKCDPADYGRLVLYQFPKKQINGPQQVAALANQNPAISQQITLWGSTGSSVSSGNLLVIPIESSLLYVMPVYLEAQSTKIPEVKQVIVALGDNVAMAPTLNEAIAQVVGAPIQSAQPMGAPAAVPVGKSAHGGAPGAPAASGGADITRLVNQAASQYQKAESAQRSGDWATYGKQIDALKQTIKELQSKAK